MMATSPRIWIPAWSQTPPNVLKMMAPSGKTTTIAPAMMTPCACWKVVTWLLLTVTTPPDELEPPLEDPDVAVVTPPTVVEALLDPAPVPVVAAPVLELESAAGATKGFESVAMEACVRSKVNCA
jgi:hypothetical protein